MPSVRHALAPTLPVVLPVLIMFCRPLAARRPPHRRAWRPAGQFSQSRGPARITRTQLIEDTRQLARIIEDTQSGIHLNGGGRLAFSSPAARVLNAIPPRPDERRVLRSGPAVVAAVVTCTRGSWAATRPIPIARMASTPPLRRRGFLSSEDSSANTRKYSARSCSRSKASRSPNSLPASGRSRAWTTSTRRCSCSPNARSSTSRTMKDLLPEWKDSRACASRCSARTAGWTPSCWSSGERPLEVRAPSRVTLRCPTSPASGSRS